MSLDALDRAVDDRFEAQTDWLRALVDTPSYSDVAEDTERCGAILEKVAGTLELEVERVSDPEGRYADHRVFQTPRAGGASRIALVGHFDTVFPRSSGFLEFVQDGLNEHGQDVIRGPGTLDMKSGLSVMFFAAAALRQVCGARTFAELPLMWICNSDEEVGSPSSAALFERLAPQLRAAMVFEGGREGDAIITERKGTTSFRIVCRGRAAHAGNHHASGRNAIHALARIIPQLEALTDHEAGLTLNVGLISGGTSRNTVPAEAAAKVDVRFLDAAQFDAVKAQVEAVVAGVDWPPALEGVGVQVVWGPLRRPMRASAASRQLMATYAHAAQACGLGHGEAPIQGGGSDANLLSAAGVPSIDGLGPYGQHFHRPQEWSCLRSLRARTKALARTLWELCALADRVPDTE